MIQDTWTVEKKEREEKKRKEQETKEKKKPDICKGKELTNN